jgi:F0F1-type ATP synthase assembly protein I
VLAAALGLPGFVVAGVLIGLWLDDRYGTSPGWTVGLGLGFLAVGIYQLIRSLR